MTKKLFYSIYLEGDITSSDFQILIENDLISDTIEGITCPVMIGENRYSEEKNVDHCFLVKLLCQEPHRISSFLNFYRDEYSGDVNDFIKKN
jgi:hypothetical protein